MSFRQQNVAQLICSNGFRLLAHAGNMGHATTICYLDDDQSRNEQEARLTDTPDDTKLPELANNFKKRLKP
ncbi:hypothetical protein [Aeromonas hydrophila]|uniref:hypothetical protein n=1 Tax=Aeromonas hydrophila TaxID=644 RepID=UPI00366A865E